MAVLNVVMLVFLATLTSTPLGSCGRNDDCMEERCGQDGPAIRFPFRLKDHQPQHCGFPGFELSCNQNQETVLENPFPVRTSLRNHTMLPFSVKFIIEKIDYKSHVLDVSKVDGCLHKLLPDLEFSASVFQVSDFYHNLSFFNCSSKNRNRFMTHIPCLSNSDYQVYTDFSTDHIIYASPIACRKMFEVPSVPTGIMVLLFPLYLTWPAPNCGYCEAEGKLCRLWNSSTSPHAECIENTGHMKELKIAGIVLGPFLIVLIATACYQIHRSRKLRKGKQLKIRQFLENYKALKPTRYSYSDIKKITGNFSQKLGGGGYGTVYKGKLSDEILVAAKVLSNTMGGGEDFINEVGTIGEIHHVNIVRLVGYCAEGYNRVLVYEFLPNGSLEKFTSSEKERNCLGLEKLNDIALGIAKGIEYLHEGCEQRILHLDIKPHNILLDQNFNPKVSDFGLAKLCSKEQSAVSMTAARGTMGYIAPEVFSRNFGKVSPKSDIYSFGMLLIEMVGGKKNISIGNQDSTTSEAYFPEWVYKKLDRGEEITIQIENEEDKITAKKLMIIGLWCIQWYPVDRPSMKIVIQMLEAEEPPSPPRNPFGSSNEMNQRAPMGGGIFVSELKSISESESEDL